MAPETDEIAEIAEPAETDDIADLDSEPPDVPRRRQRAARIRPSAALTAPAEPDVAEPDVAEPETAADEPVGTAAQTEAGASADATQGRRPHAPLDPVLVVTPDRPTTPRSQEVPRRSHRRRREQIVVATVVALMLAVAGTLAAVTIAGRGTDNESSGATGAGRGSAPVRLAFDAVPVAEGATVERAWALRGSEGDRFVGTLTFSNATEEPAGVSHTEVIPKSLAASVDDISFDPEPVVIEADPVVQFDVTVPADGTVTATYRIDVAPDGSERSRLEEWAEDLDAELAQRAAAATTTTTTTTTPPPSTASSPPLPAGGRADSPTPGDAAAPAPAPSPPPAMGAFVIAKQSVGGNGTFTFTGPGKIEVATSGGSGRSKAISVSPGRYSWTEAVPAGWALTGLECTDRDSGPFEHRSTVSGATATFNVQAGETVVCTWANRRT